MIEAVSALRDELDRIAAGGGEVRFWLRDDDAVKPTQALDRLLLIARTHDVPLTLAVIPRDADEALAARLRGIGTVTVAVHGWSHENHAPSGEKTQELGGHRPTEEVLRELADGFRRLRSLFGGQFVPMLVPPWNRIAPALVPSLPEHGFSTLSVFGPEKDAPIRLFNTHVDLMDWAARRGKAADVLMPLVLDQVRTRRGAVIGILTHHLVHDDTAWQCLDALLAATCRHPACRWVGPPTGDGTSRFNSSASVI
ncbi:polysaccharide deacetylase family protein [Rhizobium sp. TRM95111]|uniref:polysaccharide deacetylase family protein n=1 Tax=Rhizobium alarense TaxID=2846851 RepID=UPI001F2E738C|nr:polysaccharide deacetylase family protein [Rhizobium alarense]MCF3640499.1 polysaccharide deacetylase family protein [Rhizobium alarense]